MLKIATWNVNSLRIRLPQVLDWLRVQQPDILALQETKLADDHFPAAAFEDLGYRACFAGQKTYNGVALLSGHTAEDQIVDLPGLEDPQRRVLGATIDGVRVLNLYVPNGQAVGTEKYHYKLHWLQLLTEYVRQQLSVHSRFIMLGDFNIAPDDRDVHDPTVWTDRVLCSDAERAAFRRLSDLGLSDVFRRLDKEAGGFSWWDYRAASFRRDLGLRIDLILANTELAETCTGCWVDREPRRWQRPSDHAPVVATFDS